MSSADLLARLQRHYIKPGAPLPGGVFLPEVGVNGSWGAAGRCRNADGVVLACMTASEKSFPKCRGVAGTKSSRVDAHEGQLTLTFDDVKPGHYAIALLHDENGNGKADRALGMMPREGFGFSRDAKVRMGPPKFSDAAVDIGA